MKKELVSLGLVALMSGGCELKQNVSNVEDSFNIGKPDGCSKVEDIRYNDLLGQYQLFCTNDKGGKSLYIKMPSDDSWAELYVNK
jgi:hypothetical protein